MYTDFTAQVTIQQQERELTERLERRRAAAQRMVEQNGGERLAVMARLARQARAPRTATARPAGC
ncbi:hypothetical protein [Aeromicrobium stalagmiti]|uniref:hypothetical protein n=1 Tax=Aeromicrobium stalagmiti TaxID=2738988 RepID=UPI001569927A|nr:hypothetical protein [Aeromicrobium stalagmiti]NRQ51239.1 hypothetical protein [Aeromicrobium stalagmiti]